MKLCDLDEIKVCVDRQYQYCHGYTGSKKTVYREAILAVKSILHSANPVDAVPVQHGSWRQIEDDIYKCDNCGELCYVEEIKGQPVWKYCPYCGAKMD